MTDLTRLGRQRVAQGFPPTVEDQAVLARIAAVVIGDGGGAAEATPRNKTDLLASAGTTRPAPEGATYEPTPTT